MRDWCRVNILLMPTLLFHDLTKRDIPRRVLMKDWRRYACLPAEERAELHLGFLNLVCSLGLPGSEEIDLDASVQTVERYANTVERWTGAAYTEHFLPNPGAFNNSEAFFRAVSLVIALQRHCGVEYDPSKIGLGPDEPFVFDDYFIRGVLQGEKGTCATMPVIFAAVGRRLGYPIRLVCAKAHMFCRWDDPTTGERFNMEGACEGFDAFPDNHYRNWPKPISSDEERKFGYLRSMTPSEELAEFIARRATFQQDRLQFREAAEAFAIASDLDRDYARCSSSLLNCLKLWKTELQKRLPRQFPRFVIEARPQQRVWPQSVPWEVEREYAALEGLETILNDSENVRQWWKPLREGRHPSRPVPSEIVYQYPLPTSS